MDGAELLRARFGYRSAGRGSAGRGRTAARSARDAPLHRTAGAGFAARCAARRRAVGADQVRSAAILRRGDARRQRGSSRSPTGSAPWTGSQRRRCSWCGAATCGATSACASSTACRTPTTTSTRSSTPRWIARWRWASSSPRRKPSVFGTCPISYVRSHIERVTPLLSLPPGVYPVSGLSVGWPVFRRPVSMRLPPSVVVHRERYDDTCQDADDPRLRRTPPRARAGRGRQPEEQRRLSAARGRRLERERRAPALGAGALRLRRLPQDARIRSCLKTTSTARR